MRSCFCHAGLTLTRKQTHWDRDCPYCSDTDYEEIVLFEFESQAKNGIQGFIDLWVFYVQ